MNDKKIILYQFFLNSSFGHNELSLTEFSEKFIIDEIENNRSFKISKIKFFSAVESLEKDKLLIKSSKHHLTTLNSWRLTKKCKEKFQLIANKNVSSFEEFKFYIDF
tara:strand:- start:13988 stop:14308 length:321 start_codon:yes stop_codon:yes gene_type:complete